MPPRMSEPRIPAAQLRRFIADIRIGDVIVAPRDYMPGDRDGLLRVPKATVGDVVEKAEAAISTENKVCKAILAGWIRSRPI